MRLLVAVLLVVAAACGERASDVRDGTYFGLVTELDPDEFRLELDEAELLHGDEAVDAAETDGAAVSVGGSYIRDADDRSIRVTISEDIRVRLLQPCCELHEVPFERWFAGFEPDGRSFYGTSRSHYEVTVTDGKVVAVDEVKVD